MFNVADTISDHDDAEATRRQNVAAKNQIVFRALLKALRDRVSRYNERHPQDFGFPSAISISSDDTASTQSSLRVKKNIEPTSSLALDFPINSGAMQFTLSAKAGEFRDSVRLDVTNDVPTYQLNGKQHSAEWSSLDFHATSLRV
jgi:hypothetical protein